MTDTYDDELPAAETIVGRHWPLHGPYTPDRTWAAGATLSELVRYLNYATRRSEAVPYANNVADLVGTLQAAVAGLEQTLQQLDRRCAALGQDPGLYDHRDWQNHAVAVGGAEDASYALRTAARSVHAMVEALGRAHNALGSLGHNDRAVK